MSTETMNENTVISADTYIKKGGKLYKANGGSAQNILTFDSVDEMNAFNAPDGTIAFVPSEGESGGLQTVELTTVITTESVSLTKEESAKLNALNGAPAFLKFVFDSGEGQQTMVACPVVNDGAYLISFAAIIVTFLPGQEIWQAVVTTWVEG